MKGEFGGMSFSEEFKQSEYKDLLYPAQYQGEVKALQLENEMNNFSLKSNAFTLSGKSDGKGKIDLATTPIQLDFAVPDYFGEVQQSQFKISSITYNGDKLNYDKSLKMLIGEQTFKLNGLSVKAEDIPFENNTASIKEIQFLTNIEKAGEKYNLKFNFSIQPESDFVAELSGIPNLKIEHASLNYNFENLSEKTLEKAQSLYQNFIQNGGELSDDDAKLLFEEFLKNKTGFSADFAVKTASGNASADVQLKLKESAQFSEAQILSFLQGYGDFEELAQQVELKGKVAVSKAILQNSGILPMAQMVLGQYWTEDGENYVINYELRDGTLYANGKAIK